MMSTVGLELLDFVNPDLTWKTVARGYRSKSRRKPACRNFFMGKLIPDKGAKKFDDTTISDTEKNGVDVLGRHFSGKVEHLPIKKRRFEDGYLSPPKQSPPSRYELIEPSSLSKRQRRARVMTIASKFTRNEKLAKEDTSGCDEDFSGIEILAAVACDNDMVNDTGLANCSLATESAKQGSDLSTTANLNREVVTTPKDVGTSEDKIQVSYLCYGEDTSMQRSPSVMHEEQVKGARSSRVHWDLNQIPTDCCESPCSMPRGDPSADKAQTDTQPCVDKPQEDFSIQGEAIDIKQDISEDMKDTQPCSMPRGDPSVDKAQTDTQPCVDKPQEDFGIQGEAIDIKRDISEDMKDLLSSSRFNQKGDNHEASSTLGVNHGESEPSSVDVTQKCSVGEVDIVKASDLLNDEAFLEVPEHSEVMCSSTLNLTPSLEVSITNFQPSENVVGVVLLENSNGASQSTVDTEKVICENDCVTSKRDEDITHKSETVGSLEVEPVQLAKHVVHHRSPSQGVTSAFDPAILEGQPAVSATVQGQADVASLTNAAEFDSPTHDESEELMQKSSVDSTATHSGAFGARCRGPFGSLVKTIAEDPTEDNYEPDVHQADKLRAVSSEDMNGYDLQFEDGELREPDARYFWDENEDCADYGSEDDKERLCSIGNEKEKKSRSGLTEDPDNVSQVEQQGGKDGSQRDDSVSPRTRNSDVTADKEFTSGIGHIRACNRESQSCNGRHDGIRGQDPVFRSRAVNGSIYHRDEREACSRRFLETDRAAYIRGRSPGGCRFVSPSVSYWDSERRYSPPRGTYTSGPSRLINVPETRDYMMPLDHMNSEPSKGSGFDTRARRNFVKTSSIDQYERFARRTPSGGEEGYNMHRPTLNSREISPGRNNFGRYRDAIGRGMRNEYQRSIPEDNIDYRHRFAGEEKRISPLRRGRRVLYNFQYKKSRSRSRSRSPTGYLLPRERNNSQRFDNRSPEFRSNGRMDRGRVPFQKRLPAEFDEGFLSPSRGRFSPQRNPRCFDDRNGTTVDSFRGRKSPVRTFCQNQRFDSGHSFRRLNSNAPYRLTVHSRKLNVVSRRGDYEGSGDDDQRNDRDRYEMVQRVRRYDSNGDVRLFRYNAKDSFLDESRNFDDTNKLADRKLRDVATNRASEGE